MKTTKDVLDMIYDTILAYPVACVLFDRQTASVVQILSFYAFYGEF